MCVFHEVLELGLELSSNQCKEYNAMNPYIPEVERNQALREAQVFLCVIYKRDC